MQNSTETNDAIGEFKESTAATADAAVTFGDDLVLKDIEDILFARGVVGEDGDLEYRIKHFPPKIAFAGPKFRNDLYLLIDGFRVQIYDGSSDGASETIALKPLLAQHIKSELNLKSVLYNLQQVKAELVAEQKSPERPIRCTKSNTVNSNVVLPSNWHMTVDELFDYCRAQVTVTINHPTPRVFSFLACGQVYVVFMSTTMQQLIIANTKDPAFILDKTYGTTRVADALQHIGLPHGVVVGLLVACDSNHSLVNRERRIQYPQPIVAPWQNPPLPVQPFVSQITPIVHHSPYNSFNTETFGARQRIQPYFSELPVVNVPKYNVVNLGNIVVNYLLEIKQNRQHKTNADAFHSNRTSGIYHDVLNYQYFKNTLVANWQILGGENDSLELHHSCLLGDYLSVSRDDLFYHYLNKLTGKFTKLAITEASGVIKPAAKTLLDSAIEWGSDNPSAVLSYSIFDVSKVIQSQYATNYASEGTQTQPTNKEVTMLEPTSSEPIYKEAVYLSPTSVETEQAESAPNNVVNTIVRPADPEQFVDKITVPDDVVEVKAATNEQVSLEDKCTATIEKVITIVEDYVNARKEKKRNTKLYTNQLNAISNAFDFAILRLDATTDLSAIKQYEHKLNILKDELNCLNISIVSNIENPLYYVNTLLKYYK